MAFDLKRGIGVALVCASALMFQVFSTRILSVVLLEHLVLFAISFALLGMGAAASFMSIGKTRRTSDAGLAMLSLALAVTYLVAFGLVTEAGELNAEAAHYALIENGRNGLLAFEGGSLFGRFLLIGGALFLPYFVSGIFIAVLFNSAPSEDYPRYYAADLIGAASGAVIIMLVLDASGFRGALSLVVMTALGAACLFAWKMSNRILIASAAAIILAGLLIWLPASERYLEPQPSIDLLSRNFSNDRSATAKWVRWNAHSRVALVDIRYADGTAQDVYAHESGDGWALVPNESSDNSVAYGLPAALGPRKVLVIFAGVGADMSAIDKVCGDRCDITGVEINREMVEHAKRTNPQLREFLSRKNIRLEVAEAREFMARDKSRYDSILLSWWGAGVSYFLGTSGQLADYLYTREAFGTLLDHLAPDGTLFIDNGSKAQVVATLAQVFRERNLGNLNKDVVIFRKGGDTEQSQTGFYDTLENMRLMVKPSGFSSADLAKLKGFAARTNLDIILSPEGAKPGYELYWQLVSGVPVSSIDKQLRRKFGIELDTPEDSRPFVNDLVPPSYFFSPSKVLGFTGKENPVWQKYRQIFDFTLFILLLSILLILIPVTTRRGPVWSSSSLRYVAYFSLIGSGFMLIEVGLTRKFGLVLGHPSYAISVVLASLILSTGVGSLVASRIGQLGVTLRKCALGVPLYLLALLILFPVVLNDLILLPFALKAMAVTALIFPLGLLLGQFFPRGLQSAGSVDAHLVPWAWAVNGTTSTVASALAVYLSYPLGFDWIIAIGAILYGILPFGIIPENRAKFAKLIAQTA